MKYRKYILVLLLVIFIGLNRVEADDSTHNSGKVDEGNMQYREVMCYYMNEDLKVKIKFTAAAKQGLTQQIDAGQCGSYCYDYYSQVNVMSYGGKSRNKKSTVKNLNGDWHLGAFLHAKSFTFPSMSVDVFGISNGTASCPQYALVTNVGNDVAIMNDVSIAQSGVDTFKNGAQYAPSVSANEFWRYVYCNGKDGGCEIGEAVEVNCETNLLFGDVDDAGGICTVALVNGECPMGKETPPSLAYIINKVLTYIRILVPIVIILLGSFDLAKAVIAGKSDEMKKAQSTFFKRIIAGICVFLAPIFVNLLMSFADMAWEGSGYETCKPEVILKK